MHAMLDGLINIHVYGYINKPGQKKVQHKAVT